MDVDAENGSRMRTKRFGYLLLIAGSIAMILFSNTQSKFDAGDLISIPLIIFALWMYWNESHTGSRDE